MTHDNGHPDLPESALDLRLDAWLDGVLDDDDRLALETRVERDSGRRAVVTRAAGEQARIDASLRRRMAPPAPDRLEAILTAALDEHATAAERGPAGRIAPARSKGRRFALAASILMCLLGGWLIWRAIVPPPRVQDPYLVRWTMPDLYRATVDRGYEPDVVCRSDEEFAAWFRDRLGRGLQRRDQDGVAALGLGYATTLSPRTVHVLLRVEGEPVMVFVDRLAAERDHRPAPDGGLGVRRRVIGELVLYEVGPPDLPSVLDGFYDPDEPEPEPEPEPDEARRDG